jgi:hypothetical protein
MYVIALEQAIVPALDPNADDLGDYLNNRVDCTRIGQSIYDQIGGSVPLANEGFYESLCETALEAVAAVAIDKILDYDDAGVVLRITGKARPRDTNNDKKVDTLQSGKWTGVIDYNGTPANLEADQNLFTATRR